MTVSAGQCVLIVDGRRFDHCTCALERVSGEAGRGYGFLSAPPVMLGAAQAAKLVELELKAMPAQAISILHIAKNGLALFSFERSAAITVTLSSEHWSHMIVGESLRDACVKGERYVWNAHRSKSPLSIEVSGGAPGTANQIRKYLSDLRAQIALEQLSWGEGEQAAAKLLQALRSSMHSAGASASPPQAKSFDVEQLERINLGIHNAQQMIEKQRAAIANLPAGNELRELAEGIFGESLRLIASPCSNQPVPGMRANELMAEDFRLAENSPKVTFVAGSLRIS